MSTSRLATPAQGLGPKVPVTTTTHVYSIIAARIAVIAEEEAREVARA